MGITDPSEEYFKNGLWGWVSTAWKKVAAEAAGQLHVYLKGSDATVEVTQTTPADMVAAGYGWDGAAWRKLPMLWGYSDRYAEKEEVGDATAGTNTLTFSTVPVGEVWQINNVLAWNVTSANTYVTVEVYDGSSSYALRRMATVAVNIETIYKGPVILKEDDRLRVLFFGCALHDVLAATALGYKMKVAE